MKIVIATIKSWNIQNAEKIKKKYQKKHNIRVITSKQELNQEMLDNFLPDYIFFPHWSYYIPENIYERYTCVVFHMTDLPFGRGGSPLQNLIVRGMKETKVSAIRVQKELDAGPIYMKESISLEGSATEIFQRISNLVFEKMIPRFLKEELKPVEQEGEPVFFKRRTRKQSELKQDMKLTEIYDYIRMLDAEGYPNAYLDFGKFRMSFNNAKWNGKRVYAEVVITEEK